jgi:hypothetical protein
VIFIIYILKKKRIKPRDELRIGLFESTHLNLIIQNKIGLIVKQLMPIICCFVTFEKEEVFGIPA